MRPVPTRVWAALALLVITSPCLAASPVSVVMGASRDGTLHELQKKVDRLVGPGRINVRTDYLGARTGDPDPWFWLNPGRAMELTLVDRKSPHGSVGWYAERGVTPVLDGVDDAVVLEGWQFKGSSSAFRLPTSVERFGIFVVQRAVVGAGVAAGTAALEESATFEEFTTFSNRLWNDPGDSGTGATHAPFDGDMQMLVYDISRWVGPQTWLVACESSDSGRHVGHGLDDTDNDFSDVLLTISGVGTTPTVGTSFGRLKSRFR